MKIIEVVTDNSYRPLPGEENMGDLDIERAAELAKEAWTDHLIEEGRPVSDYEPEPFSVRFMTQRDARMDHIGDAIVDHEDWFFDEIFTHYCNAVTAMSTAKTYHAMGKFSKANEHWAALHEADASLGSLIRHAISRYIKVMEEKENA